jgi:hypothetical protein
VTENERGRVWGHEKDCQGWIEVGVCTCRPVKRTAPDPVTGLDGPWDDGDPRDSETERG